MTSRYSLLALLCLAACDGDSGNGRRGAEADPYWAALSARDDARNAELDQLDDAPQAAPDAPTPATDRAGILDAVERLKAWGRSNPRRPGVEGHDVRLVSQEIEDDMRRRHREALQKRRTADEDKEAEEAERRGER